MKSKYLYISLLFFLATEQIYSQIETPRTSPKASISQTIGVCKITIDYCRPSVRNRSIFGDLIPYNKVWRAGADEATTITFNHEIAVNGNTVLPGKYALFIIPKEKHWTVIFNKEWNQWGAYNYNKNEDVFRIEIPLHVVPKTELCTFNFTEISKSQGSLNLQWDTLGISIPIETNTHEQTVNEINDAIKKTTENWFVFSAAAQYYFYERDNAEKAIELIDIAIALYAPNPSPWMLKSQILASQEKFQEAIDYAQKAIVISKKHEYWYEVEENESQITKWEDQLKN